MSTETKQPRGGFAACYIASTLDPKEMERKPDSVVYESKPRKKRSYKKESL